MKDLTPEEVETAPPKVLFLWMMAIREQPVGTEMYEEALKDYPEYFPDELLHRKKWAAIPQSVHDEYYKEMEAMQKEIWQNFPPSKGIIYWANHPEEWKEWDSNYHIFNEKEKPLAEAIRLKHYGKYGV